jgi:hypothetical protein
MSQRRGKLFLQTLFRRPLPGTYATPTKRDDTHGRSHYLREGCRHSPISGFSAVPGIRPRTRFPVSDRRLDQRPRGDAPLSFTALLIAFLFGEDPVSVWFQAFVTTQNIDRRKLLDEKRATDTSIKQALRRAGSKELPPVKDLFSTSARNVFSDAAGIAIAVTPSTASGANDLRAKSAGRNMVFSPGDTDVVLTRH